MSYNNCLLVGVTARLRGQSDDLYRISPGLRLCFLTVSAFQAHRQVFTLNEICNTLSRYILERKDRLIDYDNIRILHIADDPLGQVFGVDEVHRADIMNYIYRQITPEQAYREEERRRLMEPDSTMPSL